MFGKKYEIDNVKYELIKRKSIVKVIRSPKATRDVVILPEVEGIKVTEIGESAFAKLSGITTISIPDSVTIIGFSAFKKCENLKSVVIPKSVTLIQADAFKGCTGLTNVDIPDSVTGIGNNAFDKCTGILEINIPDSVTAIAHFAFYNCKSAKKLVIGKGLSEIRPGVFANCESLTNLVIPGNVKSIYNTINFIDNIGSFEGCIGLKEVKIEDGVTFIGNRAFGGCNKLRKAIIPKSVASIDWIDVIGRPERLETDRRYHAFMGCPNLTIYGFSGSGAETYANQHCSSPYAEAIPFVNIETQ